MFESITYHSTVKGLTARIVLIIAIALLWSKGAVYAQNNATYSFSFENKSLKFILDSIGHKTGYQFAYSDTEINPARVISCQMEGASIDEILSHLAEKCNFDAEIAGNKILLKKSTHKNAYQFGGIVYDEKDNFPLPGVNISVIGQKLGTTTNSEGEFVLFVPFDANQVNFSIIGYKSQRIEIEKDTTINIYLEKDIQSIEEIVIVAFGKEQKDIASGSISTINPTVFSQINQETVNASLQTGSPGLLVQNNAGTPGSAMHVAIRGINSITAGNEPLYVLDGIPIITGNYSQLNFNGQVIDAISDISVNDIESITVLKDAAASSLFGSSSSNGVILINTKRGSKNQKQIQFNSYYGVQTTTGKLDLLNASQWMTLMNEEAIATGDTAIYPDVEINHPTHDTDWLDEIFRVAPVYNAFLSFSGGSDQAAYYLGANYFNQKGIIIGSDYERYSVRYNYDYDVSKRLSIESGFAFSYSQNNRLEGDQSLNGPLPNAISLPPVYPVYNTDGSYNNDGPFANPVSIANEEKNIAYAFRNLSYFSLIYNFNNHVKIKSQTSVDYYNLREQTFAPNTTRQGSKYNGLGIEATNNTISLYNSTFLNYEKAVNRHGISLTAGFSINKYKQHDTYLRAQNFPSSDFQFLEDAATPIITSSYETDAFSNSVYSRLKYNYTDKYYFTFNIRRDGSSKFGRNNRFGFFPSLSGLWYVSKEEFFTTNQVINKLTFQISYGVTGNDRITDFLALDLFSAGSNYHGEAGISPYQLSNPNLKWESTNQFNTGIAATLFNRINLNLDFYRNNTKDLLLEKPLPSSTGYENVISNIGKLQNQGVELEISAGILQKDLQWYSALNVSANQNKVVELYKNQPIRNIGRANSSIEVGEPVSFFYGFNALGVNPDDGLLIYEDINNDGEINDQDRTKIGSPYPLFFGGFSNTLLYKGFSFDFLFYFSYGNEIFNSTRLYTETVSIDNQIVAVLERWKQPGDITDIPKGSSYNERFSSRFVEDGSYIRLKSLKLAYSFDQKKFTKLPLSEIKVYMAAKNIWTLTKYSGMDPEVNYNGSNSIVLGTDFFTCPQPKTILFGLCATF